jgi:hypothetical protein
MIKKVIGLIALAMFFAFVLIWSERNNGSVRVKFPGGFEFHADNRTNPDSEDDQKGKPPTE